MQDEVNEKVVSLCISGGKISARILKNVLMKYLQAFEEDSDNDWKYLCNWVDWDGEKLVNNSSERAARVGRNPQTKQEITIPASKAPKFKAGKALKDSLN